MALPDPGQLSSQPHQCIGFPLQVPAELISKEAAQETRSKNQASTCKDLLGVSATMPARTVHDRPHV